MGEDRHIPSPPRTRRRGRSRAGRRPGSTGGPSRCPARLRAAPARGPRGAQDRRSSGSGSAQPCEEGAPVGGPTRHRSLPVTASSSAVARSATLGRTRVRDAAVRDRDPVVERAFPAREASQRATCGYPLSSSRAVVTPSWAWNSLARALWPWAWRSMKPGATTRPAASMSRATRAQPGLEGLLGDRHDPVAAKPDVAHGRPGRSRVDDPPPGQHHVEVGGLGARGVHGQQAAEDEGQGQQSVSRAHRKSTHGASSSQSRSGGNGSWG